MASTSSDDSIECLGVTQAPKVQLSSVGPKRRRIDIDRERGGGGNSMAYKSLGDIRYASKQLHKLMPESDTVRTQEHCHMTFLVCLDQMTNPSTLHKVIDALVSIDRLLIGVVVEIRTLRPTIPQMRIISALLAQPIRVWCDAWEMHSLRYTKHSERMARVSLDERIRRWSDIVVVMPCTADLAGRLRLGLCDSVLSNVVRAMDPEDEYKQLVVIPRLREDEKHHKLVKKQMEQLVSTYAARRIDPLDASCMIGGQTWSDSRHDPDAQGDLDRCMADEHLIVSILRSTIVAELAVKTIVERAPYEEMTLDDMMAGKSHNTGYRYE